MIFQLNMLPCCVSFCTGWMMTCTSVLFLAVEKHGGEGRILTGRWWRPSPEVDERSRLPGRFKDVVEDVAGRIETTVADLSLWVVVRLMPWVSMLTIWLDEVSIPFKCLSLQKPQTRRPIGKMLPFFMWFSRDILTEEITFIFKKICRKWNEKKRNKVILIYVKKWSYFSMCNMFW